MTGSIIVFAMLAVLTMEVSSYWFQDLPEACRPGYCFTHHYRMCICPTTGKGRDSQCSNLSEGPVAGPFCRCVPGTEFELKNVICRCPESGSLGPLNCYPKNLIAAEEQPPSSYFQNGGYGTSIKENIGNEVSVADYFGLFCSFWVCYPQESGYPLCAWVSCKR